MLPFIAIPIVAYVAKKAYDYATDDSGGSSSNLESEKQRAKEKNDKLERMALKKEIKSFKSKSKDQIQSKYNASITFDGKKIQVFSRDETVENYIDNLKSDNEELKKLIKELEESKDAV